MVFKMLKEEISKCNGELNSIKINYFSAHDGSKSCFTYENSTRLGRDRKIPFMYLILYFLLLENNRLRSVDSLTDGCMVAYDWFIMSIYFPVYLIGSFLLYKICYCDPRTVLERLENSLIQENIEMQ